jgi:hypothetical protein
LTDVAVLAASSDTHLVGRTVAVRNARIRVVVSAGGFWIRANGEELFVLPDDEARLQPGQRVNLRGIVLELPDGASNRLDD